MYNNSQSNSQSFNDSELSKGFHLLTESSHTVKVNTPSVPPNSAHLYPRLAGSNWTSYLSQPSVILGRSGTAPAVRTTRQKQQPPPQQQQVDVDFGSSKAISRKHCEVRFSARRDRWELYVHGRNGVKINHIVKKPRDKPTVLKTGALIEISNTSFVFILPNNYLKPTECQTEEYSEASTPNNDVDDIGLDHDLEIAMINILEKHSCLDTKEIMEKLKKSYENPVEKENILHLLVLSPRFHLAPNSISMSSKESDSVKWMLIPLTTNLIDADNAEKEDNPPSSLDKSTDDMSIVTPNTLVNSPYTKDKNQIISLESTDDMNITSTPATGKDGNPFSVRSYSNRDDMSISGPSMEQVVFPTLSSIHNREAPNIPTPSASLSRFFDGDEGWSVFMPDYPAPAATEEQQKDGEEETTPAADDPPALVPAPIQFHGLSIESMYSVWSYSSSFVNEIVDDNEVRPSKRLRTTDSRDSMSLDRSESRDSQQTIKADIFKEIRTKIVY